jgi:hypothetical protein
VLAGVLPAQAVPSAQPGRWVVAEGQWLWKVDGHVTTVYLFVTEHVAADGKRLIQADTWQGACRRTRDALLCDGTGRRIRSIRFTHDLLLSAAQVRITTASGKVIAARWHTTSQVPDGAEIDGGSCSGAESVSFNDIAAIKPAYASGHGFGRTLSKTRLVHGYLGLGAGTQPCG